VFCFLNKETDLERESHMLKVTLEINMKVETEDMTPNY
jgi:hypothetical protein